MESSMHVNVLLQIQVKNVGHSRALSKLGWSFVGKKAQQSGRRLTFTCNVIVCKLLFVWDVYLPLYRIPEFMLPLNYAMNV